MKANKVVDIILHAIPRAMSWKAMADEPYGSFGVDPTKEVRRVLYCVTPTWDVERYFHANNYDLLVAHHPFPSASRSLPHIVVHTALDCCTGGLNDQWRVGLGIQNAKHFDGTLGWYGEIQPVTLDTLCRRVENFMERKIIGQVYAGREGLIRSVVVCSGLGGSVNDIALKTGADCYVMGEACMNPELSGFDFIIETGHTNSEWIGARLIRKLLNPYGIRVDVAPESIDRYSGEIHTCRYTPAGWGTAQYREPIHMNNGPHAHGEFEEDDEFLFGMRSRPVLVKEEKRQLDLRPITRKWRR